MENREMQNRIRQSKFIRNNGAVLRAANVLRIKFIPITDLRYALAESVDEPELIDSINYLAEGGYLELRNIRSREPAELADVPPEDIEVKLTADGIRLLAGKKRDDCIEV